VGSEEYEEDEDMDVEGGEEARDIEEAPDIGVARAEETSKAPSEVSQVQIDVASVVAAGLGVGSERDELGQGRVMDSHMETPQDHCVSEK